MKKTDKQPSDRSLGAPCADTGAVKYLDRFGTEYEGWSTGAGLPVDSECAEVPGGEDESRARSVGRCDPAGYDDAENTETITPVQAWKGDVSRS